MFIIRLIVFSIGALILFGSLGPWMECSNWLCTEWDLRHFLVQGFFVFWGYSLVSLSMMR